MEQTVNGMEAVAPKEISEEQKEKSYTNIHKLMESTDCIVQFELMRYVYNTIIRRLKKLGDYKDCPALVQQYTKMRDDFLKKGKEEIYQNTLALKNAYSKPDDFQWIRKEASRIPGYKDADDIVVWCDEEFGKAQKQEQQRAVVKITVGVIVLLAVVLLFVFQIMPML